jgi:hypothetical protein
VQRAALIWRSSRASGFPGASSDDLCAFEGRVIVGRIYREARALPGQGEWYWTMVVFTDRKPRARDGWEATKEAAQRRVEDAYGEVRRD